MKVSRGVRGKTTVKERRQSAVAILLAVLDQRPDVTVLTRSWPVYAVQLRHTISKTVVNPDGFNPLHRERDLFYGQAWKVTHSREEGFVVETVPEQAWRYSGGPTRVCGETAEEAVQESMWLPDLRVLEQLGLAPAQERGMALTGRSLER